MPPQASRFAITRMRSRLAPGKSCQKPHRGSHVPVHALAVANTDCGSDVGALERVGAIRCLHDASREYARRTRPHLPLGRLASRGHGRQRRRLHGRLAVVRCHLGIQPGMDIRSLPVDAVPESTDRDLQRGRDAWRASDQLFRRQLLGLVLSESPVVEQPELLVHPASHLEPAAAAPTGGTSAAASKTTPAARAAGSADRTSASAVHPAAGRREASVRWAPAIEQPAALHR